MPRYPHPRITIDGGSLDEPYADSYEYDVNGVLMTIKLSRVGNALIDAFTRGLWIRPYEGDDQNSTAVPQHRRESELAGEQSHSCRDGTPKFDSAGNPIMGIGGGSDSVIYYSPRQFHNNSSSRGQRVAVGLRRDEALFHEMVHSLRQMAGVMNCSVYAGGFDTKDELCAVMTTNIYCSAFRRPLRKNHEGFEELSDEDALTFYRDHLEMVDRMCTELPAFTLRIALIKDIRFNPFRQHYQMRLMMMRLAG